MGKATARGRQRVSERERERSMDNGHVCALIWTISNKIEIISEMKKPIKTNKTESCIRKCRRENTLSRGR